MRTRLSRRTLLSGISAVALAACARRDADVGIDASQGDLPPVEVAPPAAPALSSPPAPAGPPPPAQPARFLRSGGSTSGAVALTFHASGDLDPVQELLASARRLRVPLTFFAVGQFLQAYPGIARSMLDQGHELANHTATHPALANLSRDAVASEITRCRDVLIARTGSGGAWFRPSGVDVPSSLMLEEAGKAGYATVVGYDVDPRDYEDPGAAAVLQRVVAGLHPGAIVSLHTGHRGTLTAFSGIVDAVQRRGLRLVTVSGLLRAR